MEEEHSEVKTTYRIGMLQAAFMILFGMFLDSVDLLLDLFFGAGIIFDSIIGIIGWLVFYLWFKLNNVSFTNPKTAMRFNGTVIAEIVPFINQLPMWTIGIVVTIVAVRLEDKGIAIPKMPNVKNPKAMLAGKGGGLKPPKLP